MIITGCNIWNKREKAESVQYTGGVRSCANLLWFLGVDHGRYGRFTHEVTFKYRGEMYCIKRGSMVSIRQGWIVVNGEILYPIGDRVR